MSHVLNDKEDAVEGLRFSQFYVNSPICFPSRCASTAGSTMQSPIVGEGAYRLPAKGAGVPIVGAG